MITDVVQRWRNGRASYRPAGVPFDHAAFEVALLPTEKEIKAFVLAHHYEASFPAARFRFGLYRRGGALVGAAIFSQPVCNAVLDIAPGEGRERAELGRLVLLDDEDVGRANAESWFIARCFEQLERIGLVGIVSFSDPVPRTDVDGRQVFKGHIGGIYQATNALYTGRGDARTLRLLPDGRPLNNRSLGKLRRMERGWEHVLRQLQKHGGGKSFDGDGEAYIAEWLPRITRPLKHKGNHRYVFGLTRAARRELRRRKERDYRDLPYPKFDLFGGVQ
jgi:hypothetical protein